MVVFRQQKQRMCQVGICLEQVCCLPLLKQHDCYVEKNYSFPGCWPRQSSQVTAFLRCLYFCAHVSRLGTEAPLETLVSVSGGLGCVSEPWREGTSHLAFVCSAAFGSLKHDCTCGAGVLLCEAWGRQDSLHLLFPLHEESTEMRNMKQ